jgi:hypothetical protein
LLVWMWAHADGFFFFLISQKDFIKKRRRPKST